MSQSSSPTPLSPPDDSWQTKEVFDHAKADIQSHLTEVKRAAKHTTDEVQAAAVTTAAAARDGYQAIRQDAVTHCASYRQELADRIREQPLKSVGLAALGGLVLGLVYR